MTQLAHDQQLNIVPPLEKQGSVDLSLIYNSQAPSERDNSIVARNHDNTTP